MTETSRALLAFSPSRACRLMPLVAVMPSSDAEQTTLPPGHMQKVYTPRPLLSWRLSLYSAAPSSLRVAASAAARPYCARSIID